jgi:hypothetical protein
MVIGVDSKAKRERGRREEKEEVKEGQGLGRPHAELRFFI